MRWLIVIAVGISFSCGRGTPRRPGFEPACYRLPEDVVERALDVLEVERVTVEIDLHEAMRQTRVYGGEVCFGDALVAGLAALLRDGRDPHSARAAAGRADDEACAIPMCYVDDPRARLILVGRGSEHLAPPPPVALEHTWVLALWVPALSDDLYWATVERTARPGGWIGVRSFGAGPGEQEARATRAR